MQSILLPEAPRVVSTSGNRAEIEIAGCAPGYGMTLGNALRRVLLSSLSGAAVTAVKIQGAQHEFTALPGVMENIILIMLNLKQLRFRMHAEGPLRVVLAVHGVREVKAGDIAATSELEVANPDQHIATLTAPDAKLEMELEVARGIGYVPVEEYRREKVEVGLVALDALFSPIRRVNYEVENMRVGERTDFNRVRFDIETDGTMSPEDAFTRAVEILVEQFTRLRELQTKPSQSAASIATETTADTLGSTAAEEVGAPAVMPAIEDLKLKTRIVNLLAAGGMRSVEDIVAKSEDELLAVEGLGEKAVKDLKKALGKLGLTLAEKA